MGNLVRSLRLPVERGPTGRPSLCGPDTRWQPKRQHRFLPEFQAWHLWNVLPQPISMRGAGDYRLRSHADLLPVQFYLRRSIEEVMPSHESDKRSATSETRSWIKHSLCSVGMVFGGTVPTYVVIYIAAFGLSGTSPSSSSSFAMASAIGAATSLAPLIGAALADKIGTGMMIVIARTATAITVYPVFALLSGHNSPMISVIAISTVAALSALGGVPTLAFTFGNCPLRTGRRVSPSRMRMASQYSEVQPRWLRPPSCV